MRVKIYGAGSIGNHLAQAARRIGWSVAIVDPDKDALKRTQHETYPDRYGSWDETIDLFELGEEPMDFDAVFLGTPPDCRMDLAIRVLREEKPRVLLLEKPLCGPNDPQLKEVIELCEEQGTTAVVGYDHAVSPSVFFVMELLSDGVVGDVLTLDVEFRQHWEGIFQVHPWLRGPQDTYLGFTKKGGGASGEHSHALHLWLTFAHSAGLGSVIESDKVYHWVESDEVKYDDIAYFTLKTESGVMGRVVQDVVTRPERRFAFIQGENGYILWKVGAGTNGADVVEYKVGNNKPTIREFAKTRPDDFFVEMQHIDDLVQGKVPLATSPIRLSSGVDVMDILAS